MKAWQFAVMGITAVAIGIGAAELQSRLSAKDATPQAAATAKQSLSQEAVAGLVEVINRDRYEVIKDIRADCNFRHPGEFRLIELCTEDGAAVLDQMQEIFERDANRTSRGSIMYVRKSIAERFRLEACRLVLRTHDGCYQIALDTLRPIKTFALKA